MKSFVNYDQNSDFSIHNIPFGVAVFNKEYIACATRIGDVVVDLATLYDFGYFDEIEGYDYTKIISARIKPDEAIFVIENNTVFIIEKKTQSGGGSVDEKLQTCDFKLKQYRKLFAPLNKEVKYYFLLDKSWFDKPAYRDVLDYIIAVGCGYYFNYIPLDVLGLPIPNEEK